MSVARFQALGASSCFSTFVDYNSRVIEYLMAQMSLMCGRVTRADVRKWTFVSFFGVKVCAAAGIWRAQMRGCRKLLEIMGLMKALLL